MRLYQSSNYFTKNSRIFFLKLGKLEKEVLVTRRYFQIMGSGSGAIAMNLTVCKKQVKKTMKGSMCFDNCPRRFLAQTAKARGGTLEVPAYRQDYFAAAEKNLDFREHCPQRIAQSTQRIGDSLLGVG